MNIVIKLSLLELWLFRHWWHSCHWKAWRLDFSWRQHEFSCPVVFGLTGNNGQLTQPPPSVASSHHGSHLPRLPDVPEDNWPVIIRPVQRSSEVLEHFYYLNTLRSVLPCEAIVASKHLSAIATSLLCIHIWMFFSYFSVCRCLIRCPAGMWIKHKSQRGSGQLISNYWT